MEPLERIVSRILLLRGQKVILDADLAELYGVSTGRFNEQVRRNRDRFPSDFMFRLTNQEVDRLRSQIAISIDEMNEAGHGGRQFEVPIWYLKLPASSPVNLKLKIGRALSL